jgi:ribosomal protein S19E (S16A)
MINIGRLETKNSKEWEGSEWQGTLNKTAFNAVGFRVNGGYKRLAISKGNEQVGEIIVEDVCENMGILLNTEVQGRMFTADDGSGYIDILYISTIR